MQKNWRDLIKPRGLSVDSDSLTETYGKFVAEPLERGYANTFGNALRRVLLSSLRGAAITAARFEGVLHEFSTIPEVHEDVVDIVLNLKKVVLRADSEGPYEIKVKIKGESVVTAGDLECPAGVEVINKDHVIAHVGKGGVFDALLRVETGRGFVLADGNKKSDQAIGMIAIDSLFSPITKVNFSVGQSRVGQMTNYDKLTLEVWTNGTIRPDDAVGVAARILQDQLSIFVNFDVEKVEEAAAAAPDDRDIDPTFVRPVTQLELSQRSINALVAAGLTLLGDVVQLKESELRDTAKLGPKSFEEVKAMLREMDLSLGSKIPGWEKLQRNA